MAMMKRLMAFVAMGLCLSVSAMAGDVINFNDGWKFHLGDVTNAEAVSFDDSQWRTLDLPHDFQIEQPWVEPDPSERPDESDAAANIRSRLSSRGFKEMGKGWYRKHYTPATELKGKRVVLDFEGIMYVGDVYLNGEKIGKTDYGYVGFGIDVSQKLKYGQENVIAVMADTREPGNSRWYTGGGLFRNVHLLVSDSQLYLERHPLYITTKDNREVNVQVAVHSNTRQDVVKVKTVIRDPQGQVVAEQNDDCKRNRRTHSEEFQLKTINIANAQLWDCEHPNLYTAEVTIFDEKGNAVDSYTEAFGIRTVEFSPAFGMKLNGKKLLLKGNANHHTLGALGAAVYPRAEEKRIQLLKAFGYNHIRTSHNPYSKSFLDLCDKNGILVVDELYDKWTRQHTGGRVDFMQLWQSDLEEWVKRDRNHPCVILWSFGNELQQEANMPYNDWGVTQYRLLRELIKRFDSSRLTTVAMHPRFRNWNTDQDPCDLAKITDIQSYNYRYMYFPGDGEKYPYMRFYQSEASVAAMGENYFAMDLDKVIGLSYWGSIDYLGESQGWPTKGWAQGVFDIALEPKPKAYYAKSFFSDEPVCHLAVIDSKNEIMWNDVQTGNDGMSDHWNRRAGTKLQMVVYTNADEVELFVNGKSVGKKTNDKQNAKMRNQIRFNEIEYQPGYVEAVARTNGTVVARHKVETTGEAVKLVAVPDPIEWKADNNDLQHVRIMAVDKKGRRVANAKQNLTFEVEGDARIVAVSSGDHNSNELNVTNQRKLWNGSALVILRAGKTPGKVVLKTSAEGMKTLRTTLQIKQ